MRVADYIAQKVKQETDVVFGVTGGNVINLVDAFYKAGLKVVPMHHEQAAAMAADAYARVSGKLGVCFATSGPGGQNLLTGLACSYYDSVPVLAIVGQVPTKQLGREKLCVRQYGFQESPNASTLGMMAIHHRTIVVAATAQAMVDEAVYKNRLLLRPGPVVLEVCDDVQREEVGGGDCTAIAGTLPVLQHHVNTVRDMLFHAKRPVVILGAGAMRDREVAYKFADHMNLPVLLTWGAMDLMEDDHPLNLRDFGVTSQRIGNYALKHADLILAIGTRLDTHSIVMDKEIARKCVVVDVDDAELQKAPYRDVIACDAADFMKKLDDTGFEFENDLWTATLQDLRTRYPIEIGPMGCPYRAIRAISDAAPENAIIISDAGQTVTWTFQAWKVKLGQRLFTSFNHSPMGYALPAAIGAHFAAPDRPIYCITGDGGLMMNIQELANVAGNDWPIRIYVMNNNGYGMIRQTQSDWPESLELCVACDKRTGLHFPDFSDVAQAFGIDGTGKPTLLNLWIDGTSKIAPKLKAGNRLWEQSPRLPKEEEDAIDAILEAV